MKGLITFKSLGTLGWMAVTIILCGGALAQTPSLDGYLGEYGSLDAFDDSTWFAADDTPGDECIPGTGSGPPAGARGFDDLAPDSAFNIGRVCLVYYDHVMNPDGSQGALFVGLELPPSRDRNLTVPFDSDGDGDPTNDRGIEYYRVIIDFDTGLPGTGRPVEDPCDPNGMEVIPFPQDMDPDNPELDPDTGMKLRNRGEYDFVLVSANGAIPDPGVPARRLPACRNGDPTGLCILTSPPGGDVSFSLGQEVENNTYTTGHVEFRIPFTRSTDAIRVLVIAESRGDNQQADIAGASILFPNIPTAYYVSSQTATAAADHDGDQDIDEDDACLAPQTNASNSFQALAGSSVFLHSSVSNVSTNLVPATITNINLNTVPVGTDGSQCPLDPTLGTSEIGSFRTLLNGTKLPAPAGPNMILMPNRERVLDRVQTINEPIRSCLAFSGVYPDFLRHSIFDNALIDIVQPAVDLTILVDDDPVFDDPGDLTPPAQTLTLNSRTFPLELTYFFVVTNIGETTLTDFSLTSDLPLALDLRGSDDLCPQGSADGECPPSIVLQRSLPIGSQQDCDDLDRMDGISDGRIVVEAEFRSRVKIDEFGQPSFLRASDGMEVPSYRQSVRSSASVFCECPGAVSFDSDRFGEPLDVLTDVSGAMLEDLGIRIQGTAGSNGSPGVFTNLPGPLGSDNDDLVSVSGNYITTLSDQNRPQQSDYGTLCIDFVDPLTHDPVTVCQAQLTFLDVEESLGQIIAYSGPGCTGNILDIGTTADNGTDDNAINGNQDEVTVGEPGSTLAIASLEVRFGSRFDSAAVDHLCFERTNSALITTTLALDDGIQPGGEGIPLLVFARNLGQTDFTGHVLPYVVLNPRNPWEREMWIGEPVSLRIPAASSRKRQLNIPLPFEVDVIHGRTPVMMGHVFCNREGRVLSKTRMSLVLGDRGNY